MNKVITIDPLDGDDRTGLNKLFSQGWEPLFQFLFKTEDGKPILFYHLIDDEQRPDAPNEFKDQEEEFEPEDNDDIEDNWSIN